uniref:Cytochrome c oxidase subunit 2 n=1 Tax=Phylloecus linearis TaxID=2816400 RepID=A0A1W6Q5C5_9HYME|nr:cytochrome c oxidase subunit II [Phylloecus linearis]
MATWFMMNIQDANSPNMEHLSMFHDHIMTINILITTLVLYMIIISLKNDLYNRTLMQNQIIELIWTLIPMIILLFMAFPSIKLLYLMDEVLYPSTTIKCIGHQWYWSYEYSDFNNVEFESYVIPTNELNINEFRLLEVNNRTIIPFNSQIRFLVTSMDVIHSWTIPSLGVKIDAVPGRINQITSYSIRPGLYFGQCSEICGANHSFMPIVLETTNINYFINWVQTFK